MDEQQFMAFDFKGTEKSKWPSLSFPQKQRVGPDLTDFDIPILKKFGDPMACIDGPLAQTDIDNFTFRYWFNYFYEEGAESDEINQALVTAALKLLFQRQKFPIPPKDQFTVPDKLKEYYKLRAATDADRCEALLKLLKAGYVGMRRFIGPLQEGLSNPPSWRRSSSTTSSRPASSPAARGKRTTSNARSTGAASRARPRCSLSRRQSARWTFRRSSAR